MVGRSTGPPFCPARPSGSPADTGTAKSSTVPSRGTERKIFPPAKLPAHSHVSTPHPWAPPTPFTPRSCALHVHQGPRWGRTQNARSEPLKLVYATILTSRRGPQQHWVASSKRSASAVVRRKHPTSRGHHVYAAERQHSQSTTGFTALYGTNVSFFTAVPISLCSSEDLAGARAIHRR